VINECYAQFIDLLLAFRVRSSCVRIRQKRERERERKRARAALRQLMIGSIFIILQQIPVATIDAGKDPGTLQRWCLVQPIQMQI